MFNVMEAVAAAAEVGPDMSQAAAGGGDFEIPAAGVVRLRLITYVELGKHEDEFKGIKKTPEKVLLQFELSGPRHPPREVEGGGKVPQILSLTMNKHLNEKAGFFKMFARLNYTKDAKHFAQLLGRDFLGTIVHKEVGEGADKKTYANLRNEDGYTIRPPFIDMMNEETGDIESKRVTVDAPLSAIKCFIWDAPVSLKEMWDSLFVDGTWPDKVDDKGVVTKAGSSKNWLQNQIRSALNFKSSALAELLGAGGEPDLGDEGATKPERSGDPLADAEAKTGAAADPLAGV